MECVYGQSAEARIDEETRKELIRFFKTGKPYDCPCAKIRQRWVSWLEKQGKEKPVPDWMPKFLDELRSKKNYFDWDEHKDIEGGILAIINWMNPNYFNKKDVEQKPVDIQLIEKRAHEVFPDDDDENTPLYRQAFIDGAVDYIDCGCKKPSAWSEEDEKKRTLLIDILKVNHPNEYFKVNPVNTLNMEAMHTEELVSWLESLKDRAQPQNTWKPTEYELYVLKLAAEKDGTCLMGLYEQLKKLREE